MRVVLDTNVLISGIFLPASMSGSILALWRSNAFTLITSDDLLEEFYRVLGDFRIGMAHEQRVAWKNRLSENSMCVVPRTHVCIVRDLEDNKSIEAAIEGNAHCSVSQDKDLLAVGSYQAVMIVTPAEFLGLF
jgi:uncharacterized protein